MGTREEASRAALDAIQQTIATLQSITLKDLMPDHPSGVPSPGYLKPIISSMEITDIHA